MAKTEKGQKFIRIDSYTKKDGTKVPKHIRSTPCPMPEKKSKSASAGKKASTGTKSGGLTS
ncbi:MAG: hypothetical protein FJ320_02275 [SAR202 cluster bacterium]|nr:hypothetical protein [SAR202 cluster bacterium]